MTIERELINPVLLREAGWEIAEVGDNGPATPKENCNRYERWVHSTEWTKCSQFQHPVFFDRLTGYYSQNGKEVVYMDQIKI